METILKTAYSLNAFDTLNVTTNSKKRCKELSNALINSGWRIWVDAFPDVVLSRGDGAIVTIECEQPQ